MNGDTPSPTRSPLPDFDALRLRQPPTSEADALQRLPSVLLVATEEPLAAEAVTRMLEPWSRQGVELVRPPSLEAVAPADLARAEALLACVGHMDVALRDRVRRIREGDADLPCVLVTTRPFDGSSAELVRVGADDEITLSAISAEGFRDAVMAHVERGREARERARVMTQMAEADKLAALGSTVASVAHEVNNPLTVILGFLDLIRREGITAGTQAHLEKVYAEATRCRRIVSNLLSFARKHEPHRRPMRLNDVAKQVLELRMYDLRSRAVDLQVDLDPENPRIVGDYYQLQQVVFNLVNNAEYALLKVDRQRVITVRTRMAGGRARLSVSDNGTGIPKDVLAKIFKPFFTTKPEGEGTGLGLSVVKGIVEAHGGTITVETGEGLGTTFFLEFPGVRDEAPHDDSRTSLLALKLPPSLTVLVVDDEASVREVMEAFLTTLGVKSRLVPDGREALAALTQQSFDLIISDVWMPGMNGPQFLEEIRRTRPDLVRRIIFTSGDTVPGQTARFLQDAALPVLSKPFTLDELQVVLLSSLARVRAGGR